MAGSVIFLLVAIAVGQILQRARDWSDGPLGVCQAAIALGREQNKKMSIA